MRVFHFLQSRGRDTGYPAPPAQIPACSFPAPGSSMVLASVVLTIKDVAIPPLSEVGLHYPGPTCPVQVSFEGYVPLSAPSPCLQAIASATARERPYRLRVIWADPTPCRSSVPSPFRFGYPTHQ